LFFDSTVSGQAELPTAIESIAFYKTAVTEMIPVSQEKTWNHSHRGATDSAFDPERQLSTYMMEVCNGTIRSSSWNFGHTWNVSNSVCNSAAACFPPSSCTSF